MIGLLAFVFPAGAQEGTGSDQVRALGRCGGCTLVDEDHSDRMLMGLDLQDATIIDVTFDRAKLSIAVFDDAILERVSFAGADLSGARFVRTRLVDVIFDGADLSGAVFEEAVLERIDFLTSHMCNNQMPTDFLDNSDCGRD